MEQLKLFELKEGVNTLPRGGFLVPTSEGYVQFGAPPETIKDTMQLPEKVPCVFVLPVELFNVEKGIAMAELEFPIYYNYFFLKKKTLVIGTEKQKESLIIVLNESVFGPAVINLESEYPEGSKSEHYPNLLAEMRYFSGDRKLSDLVDFGVFDKDYIYNLGNVRIQLLPNQGYQLYDKDVFIANIPLNISYHIKYDIGKKLDSIFDPPEFGITCLGPSHGFDPEDNTSGFILWINHHGIMIDPPVNSTEWLRESNVNPRTINHIILTHCHADHDAGTFQKILEEVSVYIHTTETIMDSFIRKYTALTGVSHKDLYELFNFCPVMIDSPLFIEGAQFYFHYSLHSVPTLGFKCFYRDQSFLYTSDHLNNPDSLEIINKTGALTEGRYKFLKNFPWHLKTIYHEAGVPPLHTPIAYLASLDKEIQEKIHVYHIARKDFPQNTSLKLAKFGIENTYYPEIRKLQYASAVELLDLLVHIDLFENFPISKAKEFLEIVTVKDYHKGDIIIHKGDLGDAFYMIISGHISVRLGNQMTSKTLKIYDKYEYFGEVSLMNNEVRSADIIAENNVKVALISKSLFLNFIAGTEVENILKKLSQVRTESSWHVLSNSKIFGTLTSHQKTQLEINMESKVFEPGHILFTEGSVVTEAYILISGSIQLEKQGLTKDIVNVGDFIGDIFSLQKGLSSSFTAKTITSVEVYAFKKEKLSKYIQKNPGVYMRLIRYYNTLFDT